MFSNSVSSCVIIQVNIYTILADLCLEEVWIHEMAKRCVCSDEAGRPADTRWCLSAVQTRKGTTSSMDEQTGLVECCISAKPFPCTSVILCDMITQKVISYLEIWLFLLTISGFLTRFGTRRGGKWVVHCAMSLTKHFL